MFKRAVLHLLFRLRAFMQEEIIAEIRILRGEQDRLRDIINRLEGFEHTARNVEDALLTLALEQCEADEFEPARAHREAMAEPRQTSRSSTSQSLRA